VTDNNDMIAELHMWQSRVSDLETSNGRLREERDALLSTISDLHAREQSLLTRLTELDNIVQRMSREVSRHRADGELYP
jgi:predicted nuclease with TOPRIM domain